RVKGREASRRSLNYTITKLPNSLDSPEIVFLLRLFVLRIAAVNGHPDSERIRLRTQWKGLLRFRLWHRRRSIDDRRLCWSKRLNQRRRRARGLVCVADQFQQVMIFHMFNLVCQTDKATVNIVQSAA